MRDAPTSLDLMGLAREVLLDELAPLLPPERRRDAHLVATVIAMVAREASAGEGWQQEIEDSLADLYGDRGAGLARLAADLRNGAFETSPSRAAAARAILWRLTIEKLGEANPGFLVANGFRKPGREST